MDIKILISALLGKTGDPILIWRRLQTNRRAKIKVLAFQKM